MAEAAAIIHIGREREQREILPVHVVLEVEDARETGAGNLRLVPGAIGLLGRKQITQPALHARPVQIAARADAHYPPRPLPSGARAAAFCRRIIVGGAGLAPAAVWVLATLQP